MCWTKTQMASAAPRLTSMVVRTRTLAIERTRMSATGTMVTHERSKLAAKEPLNDGAMPLPAATGPSAT